MASFSNSRMIATTSISGVIAATSDKAGRVKQVNRSTRSFFSIVVASINAGCKKVSAMSSRYIARSIAAALFSCVVAVATIKARFVCVQLDIPVPFIM